MRNIWTIARREYNHHFITPIAYVVAITILLVIGIWRIHLHADADGAGDHHALDLG